MKNIFETMQWIREPGNVVYRDETMEVTTKPHTDLWQNTYYHFCNDNAPVCVMDIEDPYFTMTVKTDFDSAHHRFDQCGVVIYQDTENWLKASCEYENETFSNLGSVVTNHGYSDWAVTEISPENKTIWYRLSRRADDYRIEYSFDGIVFHMMRIAHLIKGKGTIRIGVYACSPEESSFTAVFSSLAFGPCLWQAHDGQQPD